ncbi:hypothetical protein [Insolitispirillum peregrinum]|uniref:Uncharacterized protein n=1 Tax=Insolitispirillum peregrinum TaxID=80876 RepID=A0A1N7NIZ7_9PROT|nr:hypothetical protein [Insolitispirillum peregrinum]SIS98316.1 hypothetical protein SAMN05421779_105157 [Insolitispirillum peregrinum]
MAASKYGDISDARDRLATARTLLYPMLGLAPPSGAGMPTSPPVAPPVAIVPPPLNGGGRPRSSGATGGSPTGGAGSAQLVMLKVAVDDAVRLGAAYDLLPSGQLAVVASRLAALRQFGQAIATASGKAALCTGDVKAIKKALEEAAAVASRAVGMMERLNTMYSNSSEDPSYHWRLVAGLVGGQAVPGQRAGGHVWTQGLSPVRVMEYLTPNRSFGGNWSAHIGQWLHDCETGQTNEPFFLWCETRVGIDGGAEYLSDAAQKAALVTLKDGQLCQLAPSVGGEPVLEPFSTSVLSSLGESYDMFMAYCIDEHGVLYVYPHPEGAASGLVALAMKRLEKVAGESIGQKGRIYHSSGHRGEAVAGAGMIWAANGSVVAISTKSGHYWPTIEMFLQTLAFLEPALGNGVAYFDFLWDGDFCVASCPARDFLRIGRAGFSPAAVSEAFLFGDMDMKTGAINMEEQSYSFGDGESASSPYGGKKLRRCVEYFLATFSRFSGDQTRRILEERRLANRTRLGIYKGRTLDAEMFREWEREQMLLQIARGDEAGFQGATPFDKTALDGGAAARHEQRMQGLENGGGNGGRARSNNFRRYK